MRNIVIIVILMFSTTIFAQEVKPTFEKQGDQIKGTFFYEDGTVSQSGFYNEKGILHGKWKSFDRTGNKIASGQYTNGVKTGKWMFWEADRVSEVSYTQNKIVGVNTKFNKDNVAVNYK